VLCKRCGSINVVRTRSSLSDKIARFFTGKKRVTCRHCLWTARVLWSKPDDHVPKRPAPRGVDDSNKVNN
jgi:hypothetical protein